ncbi:MAG TPA: protein kinase [Gemmatimonadales bacterium]|nr:protein kinase [Gemmatimonadales bacterium]
MTDPAFDLSTAVQAALEPHYRLERELGRGGMGVVYQATDRTLDRRVAIKVAHPELTEKPAIAQRFLAEARMLARIQHPNIVAIHHAGRIQNLHYYVMDEVPGESLRQLLNREGALPVERARAIASDIAAALHAAGGAGFVHRDVKPENVLLDAATGRALLADFGIARAPDGVVLGSTTGQGIAVGTPTYMSPEQAAGEPVDPRSDLYSLGVVAYEMLVGEPPFVGPNRVVVSRHLTERPVPLDRACPGVPKQLAAAVRRALEKAPADRWQTGAEMQRALAGDRVLPRGAKRLLRAAGVAAALAIVALGGWWAIGRRGGPPPGVDPRHSMLLLPFENLQQDRTLGWLSDGSVSMLGLNLAQWSDLTVVEHDRLHDLLARQGLAPGDPIGLEMARRMARDAGVWTVVRGEFSWAGDTLRLVARVYDVATGTRVHVARVDARPGEDVRPMFDQLAARLLDLSGAPADALVRGLAATTTHSLEAFRRYLAGVELLNRWNLPAAAAEFERATAIDSTFALAYYRLAHTLSWIGMGEDSAARAALDQASRHSEGLPEHHRIAIDAYQAFVSTDMVTARALYQRLLTRDHDDREAWNGLAESWFHDTIPNRSLAYTQAYRAFRRALAIDPAYAVPYRHVTDLLMIASAPRPPVELLAGDSVHDRESLGRTLRTPGRADAVARARAQWTRDARAWVVAQPTGKLAHVSLLDAHLRSGEFAAALAEVDRFRGVAGDRYPEFPFERASVHFAAGRVEQAVTELGRALDTATITQFTQVEARPVVVRAIASAANVYAYRGDLEGARRAITFAAEIGARLDSTLGHGLPRDLAERRMLGDLYAAFGGPAPSLRQLWATASEAGRGSTEFARRIIAASGASAAIGLATGGDTLAVAELRPLVGAPLPPEVDAMVAMARRDTASARRLVAQIGERMRLVKDDRLLYTVFTRPIAAQVLYALGDYAGALRVAEGFEPAEFDVRQFDMRWGMLPRMRLLRGLAHERLGHNDAAAAEYEGVLMQWDRADPLLHPVLAQAERGLRRLGRGTGRLEALGYQLTDTKHLESGCPASPVGSERK